MSLRAMESVRSDAGMLHLLDNPICSVINRTHYKSGDGSALIKASTSLLRAFMHTNTHTADLFSFQAYLHPLDNSLSCERRGCQMGQGVWKQTYRNMQNSCVICSLAFGAHCPSIKVSFKDKKISRVGSYQS